MLDYKPVDETPADYRGISLLPGRRVAFNLSGAIAIGVLTSTKVWRSAVSWGDGWHRRYDIRIELLHDYPGIAKAGHISKVKHPRSVLVLD
jgi:hypothetical protein